MQTSGTGRNDQLASDGGHDSVPSANTLDSVTRSGPLTLVDAATLAPSVTASVADQTAADVTNRHVTSRMTQTSSDRKRLKNDGYSSRRMQYGELPPPSRPFPPWPQHGIKVRRLKVAIDKRLTVVDESSSSVLKYKTPHFRLVKIGSTLHLSM